MSFWRPSSGGDAADVALQVERGGAEGDAEPNVVVFPSAERLSVQQQRARLPIAQYREQFLYLVERYATVVLVGETGSGKTTQIPQFLLEAGWAPEGRAVCVTQPRRVAAISVAKRVADETGATLGKLVGYTIRFDNQSTSETRIKFVTDGLLLREMMLDPLLSKYTVVMLDEAHERSVYTDVLLSLLKKVQRRRPDLRVIISSATVNAEEFRDYFSADSAQRDSVAILSVDGRCFPVDILYLPEAVSDYAQAAVETVLALHRSEPPGDVLVFLTGQEEIDRVCERLVDESRSGELVVLPLYSALPPDQQMGVFGAVGRGQRKVIVSTNIAETSVTIPNIVYIVDSGLVKQRWFDPRTGMDALVVCPISQASANQRAGRAGRVANGKAFRLYTEEAFRALAVNDVPEIQRTNLCPIVLLLKALGIRDVVHFDFMSPPPAHSLARALETLFALGALDADVNLTSPIGVRMAEFPVEPMLARMLFASVEQHCGEQVLSIAAMLCVQGVFVSGNDRTLADKTHKKFFVTEGDHLTLLNVYLNYKAQRAEQAAGWCRKNFVSFRALQRADEIRRQLKTFMWRFRLPVESSEDPTRILLAVVSGFFPQAALLQTDGSYRTVKDAQTVHIHPNSCLFKLQPPEFVVYHEIVHTTKKFMRDVSSVDPKWLPTVAPHYYEFRRAGAQQQRLKS